MEKNHDCISKVRQQVKDADPTMGWVKFELSTIKNMNNYDGINKTGQAIRFSYTHTKRDGTTVEKTGKSFVTHNYCPFCGKKY